MKLRKLQLRVQHVLCGLTGAISMDFSCIHTPNLGKKNLQPLYVILYKNDPSSIPH